MRRERKNDEEWMITLQRKNTRISNFNIIQNDRHAFMQTTHLSFFTFRKDMGIEMRMNKLWNRNRDIEKNGSTSFLDSWLPLTVWVGLMQ